MQVWIVSFLGQPMQVFWQGQDASKYVKNATQPRWMYNISSCEIDTKFFEKSTHGVADVLYFLTRFVQDHRNKRKPFKTLSNSEILLRHTSEKMETYREERDQIRKNLALPE